MLLGNRYFIQSLSVSTITIRSIKFLASLSLQRRLRRDTLINVSYFSSHPSPGNTFTYSALDHLTPSTGSRASCTGWIPVPMTRRAVRGTRRCRCTRRCKRSGGWREQLETCTRRRWFAVSAIYIPAKKRVPLVSSIFAPEFEGLPAAALDGGTEGKFQPGDSESEWEWV